MNDHSICPAPFLLNALKHHVGYIKEFVHQAKSENLRPEQVNVHMMKIGKSMIDIYYGKLTQMDIVQDIKAHLESIQCYNATSFYQYISSTNKNFRNIKLGDGSIWTLLIGNEQERYIHIHPSRGSEHTLRARATALKTAIFLLIFYPNDPLEASFVNLVNVVRTKFMQEAPIKNEAYTKGLIRVLSLF